MYHEADGSYIEPSAAPAIVVTLGVFCRCCEAPTSKMEVRSKNVKGLVDCPHILYMWQYIYILGSKLLKERVFKLYIAAWRDETQDRIFPFQSRSGLCYYYLLFFDTFQLLLDIQNKRLLFTSSGAVVGLRQKFDLERRYIIWRSGPSLKLFRHRKLLH